MPRAVFACTYENCTAIFRHSDRYERHLLKHSGERPFKCTYDGCDKTYLCSSHLKRHAEIHEKMFKCKLPGCSLILKTKATLMKHQDEFHKKKAAAKKYKCSECSEEFTKHSMLTRHLYCHTGIQAYKCFEPGCDKSFSMPSLLKRHIKRHAGYFCDEADCAMHFPSWSLLLKHRREKHPKIYRCHICEKTFNYSSNLKAHSLTHKLESDVYQCYIGKCNRVYKTKHSLSDHVRTFHSTFTLACPEGNCHRFLKTEDALEKHIQHCHRRRMNKKPPPKKPDFAEILSGFAKGSKKDLNPHLSRGVSEEQAETICIDSSDITEGEPSSDAQGSKWDLNRSFSNTILEDKIENDKTQCSIKEKNIELRDVNVEIPTEPDSLIDLADDNEQQTVKCPEQDLKLSYSDILFKELIETDAALSDRNVISSCKLEVDQLQSPSNVNINKVK